MPTPEPEGSPPASTDERTGSEPARGVDDLVRQFVEHWGMMARSWGINATMGELFALLYITGTDWTADALRERLQVSRGNVSMNLRELIGWGVVHKVHRQGQRREFYHAETDVWTLFRRILQERKRRELDPTLVVLNRSAERVRQDPSLAEIEGRIASLRQFFGMINALATRLLSFESDDLDELGQLLAPAADDPGSSKEFPKNL